MVDVVVIDGKLAVDVSKISSDKLHLIVFRSAMIHASVLEALSCRQVSYDYVDSLDEITFLLGRISATDEINAHGVDEKLLALCDKYSGSKKAKRGAAKKEGTKRAPKSQANNQVNNSAPEAAPAGTGEQLPPRRGFILLEEEIASVLAAHGVTDKRVPPIIKDAFDEAVVMPNEAEAIVKNKLIKSGASEEIAAKITEIVVKNILPA